MEKDVLQAAEGGEEARCEISPVARKMAEDLGIHVDELQGTGPGGRIVKEDVLHASEAASKKKAAPAKAPG